MFPKKTCEYEDVIEGIPVIIRKGRARTMRIYVYPNGKTVVSAPHTAPDAVIYAFVRQKAAWIKVKLSEFAACNAGGEKTNSFCDGEDFYFFGEKYSLSVKEGKAFSIALCEGKAIFTVPRGADENGKIRAANAWYKKELIKFLTTATEVCERLTGLKSSGFNVRNMRTRWGSCNVKTKQMTFNLQLAKTPANLIEYVVLHEILHIKVPNHGAGFKSLLSEYMPDWKDRKRKLNEAGRIYAHM